MPARHSAFGGVILSLCTAASPLRAAPARDGAIVRASLEIDASETGDAASVVKEKIRVRGEALLRAHDVLPARGPSDPIIAIAIAPMGKEPGYRCRFAVRRDGEVVPDTEGTTLCRLCTEDELVDHVEAAIERVVPQVPASAPASTASTPPRSDAAVPPRRHDLRALGKAGLATAITGGVLLGVGVGLAVRDVPPSPRRPDPPNTRPAGIAIASISAAMLIAGIVMVAVDMRRPPRSRRASVRLAPDGLRGAF